MRIRTEQFERGAYYHVYNHSAKGQLLFRTADDYTFCLHLLQRYLSPEKYHVCALCLMPNHYHILVQQLTDDTFTKPFFSIWNGYAKHYNRIYGEYGSVFCQKLQHIWISNEHYLMSLITYIHLNPLKAGLCTDLNQWLWSDYPDWVGQRKPALFYSPLRNELFTNPADYKELITTFSNDKIDKSWLMDS